MLQSLITWLIDIGMAIGPIMGYVSQYRLIKVTKSVGSFSIDICGILLFANILRLNFYLFKRYETALVFQSLFMIAMQMILLRECSKYPQINEEQSQGGTAEEIQPALDTYEKQRDQAQKFWRWIGFQRYGVTVLFFVFCTFMLSGIFKLTVAARFYGQFVGILALMSQSILILPQIIRNIEKQSTKGLSYMLVTFNIIGDILKLTYFVINKQPFQFILCGIIQVALDTYVILQIFYYNSKKESKRKMKKNQPMSPIKPTKIHEEAGEGGNALSIQKLCIKPQTENQLTADNNEYNMSQQIQLDQNERKHHNTKISKKQSNKSKKQVKNNQGYEQFENEAEDDDVQQEQDNKILMADEVQQIQNISENNTQKQSKPESTTTNETNNIAQNTKSQQNNLHKQNKQQDNTHPNMPKQGDDEQNQQTTNI